MKTLLASFLLLMVGLTPCRAEDSPAAQIDDQVWATISRTVVESDIQGMAATYHPDAVLVGRDTSLPMSTQLVKWGEDMVKLKDEGSSASVEFRFAHRFDDPDTAFEQGLFRYVIVPANGPEQVVIAEFESLLIKKDGRWVIVMERQLGPVDEAAWEALAP